MTTQPARRQAAPAGSTQAGSAPTGMDLEPHEAPRGEDALALRRRIGAERAQLARTVEELAARFDVRSRLRQRRSELRQRVRARAHGLGLAARRLGSLLAIGVVAAVREMLGAVRRLVEDLRSGRVSGPRALPAANAAPNSVPPTPLEVPPEPLGVPPEPLGVPPEPLEVPLARTRPAGGPGREAWP